MAILSKTRGVNQMDCPRGAPVQKEASAVGPVLKLCVGHETLTKQLRGCRSLDDIRKACADYYGALRDNSSFGRSETGGTRQMAPEFRT